MDQIPIMQANPNKHRRNLTVLAKMQVGEEATARRVEPGRAPFLDKLLPN